MDKGSPVANGRHSYVAFYPSDWIGGTARISSRIVRSVYFDVCLYTWDTAEACPPLELAMMLGDVDGWERIIDQLIVMKKLIRNDDGSVYNPKALAEAEKAFKAWQKMSAGGKGNAKGADKGESKGDAKPPGEGASKPHENGDGIELEPEPEPEDSTNPYAGEEWDGWIAMRTKARKVPTERAIELSIMKLAALAAEGHDHRDVLNQSTMNGWTGLFAVKEDRGGRTGKPSGWS